MFLTGTCQSEDMKKGPFTRESFHLAKFSLVVSVGKLGKVFFYLDGEKLVNYFPLYRSLKSMKT